MVPSGPGALDALISGDGLSKIATGAGCGMLGTAGSVPGGLQMPCTNGLPAAKAFALFFDSVPDLQVCSTRGRLIVDPLHPSFTNAPGWAGLPRFSADLLHLRSQKSAKTHPSRKGCRAGGGRPYSTT